MDILKNNVKIRKNIAWLFGVISIILAVGSSLIFEYLIHCNAGKSWFIWVSLYFLLISFIGIWGLVKGIKTFKVGGKVAGIMGIILNIIGAGLSLFLGYGAGITIFVCTT